MCGPGTLRGQKDYLELLLLLVSLELVLQVVISCHVDAGNRTLVLHKSSAHS